MNKNIFSAETYVLSIAIDDYQYFPKLKNAVNDGIEITNILKNRYNITKIICLHNDVNIDKIAIAFKTIKETIDKRNCLQDEIIIFYNGHGYSQNDEAFWVLTDSKKSDIHSLISFNYISTQLQTLNKAAHITIFSNNCFADQIKYNSYFITTQPKEDSLFFSRKVISSGRNQIDDNFKNTNHSPFIFLLKNILLENNNHEIALHEILSKIKKQSEEEKTQIPIEITLKGDESGIFKLRLKDSDTAYWNSENNKTLSFYQKYLISFPKGAKALFAKEQIDKLKDIELKRLKNLEAAEFAIKKFIHEDLSKYFIHENKDIQSNIYDINKNIENLCTYISKNLNLLIEEEQSSSEYEQIKDPNNKNYGNIENKINSIKNKIEQDAFWAGVMGTSKPHTRLSKCLEYINKFSNDCIYQDKANKQINEANNFIQIINEKIDAEKRKKLEKYLEGYINTEWHKLAKKELDAINNDFNAAFNKALNGGIEDWLEFLNYYTSSQEFYVKTACNEIKIQIKNENIKLFDNLKNAIENINIHTFINMCEDFLFYFENSSYSENSVNLNLVKNWYEELTFYKNISSKEGYEKYLNKYGVYAALMAKEANQKINKLIYKEDRSNLYNKIIHNSEASIELCNEFINRFFEDDDLFKYIKNKKELLEKQANGIALYNKIIINYENNNYSLCIDLCEEYIIEYIDQENWVNVKIIQNDATTRLQNETVEKENIERENKINTEKINAENIYSRAFIAYQSNDFIEAQKLFLSYLYDFPAIILPNIENAKETLQKVSNLLQEETDFELAVSKDTEDAYIEYIVKYGRNGNHYSEVFKLLNNKQLGITTEMLSLDNKIELTSQKTTTSIVEALQDLKTSIVNSNAAINNSDSEKNIAAYFDKINKQLKIYGIIAISILIIVSLILIFLNMFNK
jgi:hypothetical protein